MPVNLLSSGGGTTTLTNAASASNFTLTLPAATGTVLTNAAQSIPKAALPTGSVLQVVSNTTTGQAAYTLNNTFEQATMFNTAITPTSSSSRILITVAVMFGTIADNPYPGFRLTRNGSEITAARGVTNGSRKLVTGAAGYTSAQDSSVQSITMQFLDSPATTSAVTYGIQVVGFNNRTFYINITGNSDANAGIASVSSMTLLEIAS
jgi:hypothetical protein